MKSYRTKFITMKNRKVGNSKAARQALVRPDTDTHLQLPSTLFTGIYLTALMCITAMSTTAHVVCDKLVSSANIRKEVPYLANKVSV